MRRSAVLRLAVALAAGAAALTAAPSSAAAHTAVQGCLSSVPEPGTSEPVQICYSLFKPGQASAAHPVPFVMHSHGWLGSRTKDAPSWQAYLDQGYGVLSFDQRGFGESGGKAHVENPDIEGKDVQALVDLIARLPWVLKEDKAGRDPVLGAIGGSYGGGYQFLGAFTELRDRGATRFDALAPEITWNDLKTSLGPSGVGRSTWLSALMGGAAADEDDVLLRGYAYLAATGQWPTSGNAAGADWDSFFRKTGPAWHVAQGRKLDIPVLFRQGLNDSLFNLNQAVANFETALTPRARARSMVVGYNGGHVLPGVLPPAASTDGDPCSRVLGGGKGTFGELTRRFFAENLKGKNAKVTGFGRYHLATPDSTECLAVPSVTARTAVPLGTVLTTGAAGAPVQYKLADGPITLAGIPRVDGLLTAAGVGNRAFFGLSTGVTAADARLVQNNMMPLNEEGPVLGGVRTVVLAGLAIKVPAGQSLFLTVSPVSDAFPLTGSRTPGAMVLQDAVVRLPVVR